MEILGITLTAWSALVVTLASAVIAGVMLVIGTNRLHFIWGAFCAAVCVYAIGFFMVAGVDNPQDARFWWKIEYIGTILIPFIFLHFVFAFLNRARLWVTLSLYLLGAILIYINLNTDLIINEVSFMFGELFYNSPPGLLHPLVVAIYVILIGYGHYLLFKAYRMSTEKTFQTQIRYFFIATSVGFIGGIMNFIAVYGVPLHPATQLTILVAMPLIGYAILKYQLFGVSAVLPQFLTLVLSAFALAQLILSDTQQELIFNIIIFAVILIVGMFFIRSARKEVEQRQELERITDKLEKANAQLRELDQQKSEFVSIASHQLRSPLTAIKGYGSMLLEGSFGKVPEKLKEPVKKMYHSSQLLVNLVEDLLNVTRIEQGRMQYEKANIDIAPMIENIIEEVEPNITHPDKVTVELNVNKKQKYTVSADEAKIRQVFLNLIDNAIKYTPEGTITVSLSKPDKGHVLFSVSDEGIGFSEGFKQKDMFGKFNRASNGQKLHASGSGIGLYVAKEITEAHDGKIWAESEGEGKGATFYVELPTA